MADVRSEPETPRRGVYDDLRPLLFSIAYGIVSSVSEAEDIVQEAFLRFHRAQSEGADIDSPRAWLSTVTTRLAINQVRSARARRETYVGTWLPEPLLTDPAPDASVHAETADSLSMALLVLLESLSPVERAVFLLREVFGYGYDEIAGVVDKTEDNCRQLAARARRHVESRKPRFEASRRSTAASGSLASCSGWAGRHGRPGRGSGSPPSTGSRGRSRSTPTAVSSAPSAWTSPRARCRRFARSSTRTSSVTWARSWTASPPACGATPGGARRPGARSRPRRGRRSASPRRGAGGRPPRRPGGASAGRPAGRRGGPGGWSAAPRGASARGRSWSWRSGPDGPCSRRRRPAPGSGAAAPRAAPPSPPSPPRSGRRGRPRRRRPAAPSRGRA